MSLKDISTWFRKSHVKKPQKNYDHSEERV